MERFEFITSDYFDKTVELYGLESLKINDIEEEVKKHLKETSVENKEFTLQFKELNIKFHTLWSGLDTDRYIGVIGQIDRRI